MRAVSRMKKVVCILSWVTTLFWLSSASAQPVPSAFVLSPTFGLNTCINGTRNGFTGSDSLIFTAPATGNYSVSGFSGGNFWAFVNPGTYDTSVRIIDQSLASNYPGSGTSISLTTGETAQLVAFFNSGFGSILDCEADDFSEIVSGDIVAVAAAGPATPVPAMPFWPLALMVGFLSLLAVRKLRKV